MITLKKLGAPSTSYTKKRKELNPLTCKSSLSVRSHQNVRIGCLNIIEHWKACNNSKE